MGEVEDFEEWEGEEDLLGERAEYDTSDSECEASSERRN